MPREEEYEYCRNCDANLTKQKGYSNELPYWICRGCGMMLISPKVKADDDIAWICDGCAAMLNVQKGFSEELSSWKCTECGYDNEIDIDKIYLSEDEYQQRLHDPYKGLSDEDVLELSVYKEISSVGDRDDIVLVYVDEVDSYYIKKYLKIYNKSIYEHLKDNPIANMPRIMGVYESDNCLIVIEEYIQGRTLDDILMDGVLSEEEGIRITREICSILDSLHNQPTPIIHRDIKPSNIMIDEEGKVYLLDVNVAKWFDSDKKDDTKYLGTQNYAAPEQIGFGLNASSPKSDVYALGVLLNVMITGAFPKEKSATGKIWDVIKRCIKLEADDRYSLKQLEDGLDSI